MKKTKILAIQLAAFALVSGCKTAPPEFSQIRRESHGPGALMLPALYTRAGDTNHVYMKSADGTQFYQMPR